MALNLSDPLQWSRRRAQNSHRCGAERIEKFGHVAGQSCRTSSIAIHHKDSGQRREWRIEHCLAISRFMGTEVFESLGASQLKRVMVGKVTLNDNFPGLVATSGPACNLGE